MKGLQSGWELIGTIEHNLSNPTRLKWFYLHVYIQGLHSVIVTNALLSIRYVFLTFKFICMYIA